jgi:hypothetical protein
MRVLYIPADGPEYRGHDTAVSQTSHVADINEQDRLCEKLSSEETLYRFKVIGHYYSPCNYLQNIGRSQDAKMHAALNMTRINLDEGYSTLPQGRGIPQTF